MPKNRNTPVEEKAGIRETVLRESILTHKYRKYVNPGETVHAARGFITHVVLSTSERVIVIRRFPRAVHSVDYHSLVSVENKRLTDMGAIGAAAVFVALYALIPTQYLKPFLTDFIKIINTQLGKILPPADDILNAVSLLCAAIAAYYAVKFLISLLNRLLIYREGRIPLLVPMPADRKTAALISTIQLNKSRVAPVTEEKVKEIIGAELRKLLDERAMIERELRQKIKMEAAAAATDEEKAARIKEIIEEGLKRLENKDEEIGKQIDTTGLKRDEVFKKYHIKMPKEDFIQSVLTDANLKDIGL